MDAIKKLNQWVQESNNIVFFGGAGVSTESGIPDFRSDSGIFSEEYSYNPETILSRTFFYEHTDVFYQFYHDKIVHKEAKPNKAHIKLSELEKKGKLKAVITQNIDGLHQLAGSKNVYELHGSIHRNYCINCNEFYDIDYMLQFDNIATCKLCDSLVKPDVVLYQEALNNDTVQASVQAIANADVLIVAGTSLLVYPAAGMIDFYNGNKLVLINKSSTSIDGNADLLINDNVGKVMDSLN